MAKKIFISYKYHDDNVAPLKENLISNPFFMQTAKQAAMHRSTARNYVAPLKENLISNPFFMPTAKQVAMHRSTARNYVDYLAENNLKDEIHKFEKDDDDSDLTIFVDSTIASKLRDKIFDSSITIVLISANMIDPYKPINEQWIPWEISYSLKEIERKEGRSLTNAILSVALPDRLGNYGHAIEQYCPSCDCRTIKTSSFFEIIGKNMLNIKEPTFLDNCSDHKEGTVYTGDSSYIQIVTWDDFISNHDKYIDKAVELRDKASQYNIKVELNNL